MMAESRSAVALFVGAVLTVSGPVSGSLPGAGVVTDPGAWTIVPEWNAIPSGPATDVNTERGCEDLCSATPGCVQWTWNYGHKVRRRVIKTKPQTPVDQWPWQWHGGTPSHPPSMVYFACACTTAAVSTTTTTALRPLSTRARFDCICSQTATSVFHWIVCSQSTTASCRTTLNGRDPRTITSRPGASLPKWTTVDSSHPDHHSLHGAQSGRSKLPRMAPSPFVGSPWPHRPRVSSPRSSTRCVMCQQGDHQTSTLCTCAGPAPGFRSSLGCVQCNTEV